MLRHFALAVTLSGLVARGDELQALPEKNASDGEHLLSFGLVPFGHYGFMTRGYNGQIPGPTFRVKPGETLQIQLVNLLAKEYDAPCSANRSFCEVSTTNLHTHGLHASPKGMKDGLPYESDDIFTAVGPQEKATFHFEVPGEHMGGTHWYHPHHHHSTALAAGGGAAGVLIVDDPVGYLPPVYASMIEKVVFITGHNLKTLQSMSLHAKSHLLADAVSVATTAGLRTNVFMVNGQVNPTLTMVSNTWYRFRMVFASVEQSLNLHVEGTAKCQLKLMAKDGIYLNRMPRDISSVILVPGGRADVAVSCTCYTYPCTASVTSKGSHGPLYDPDVPVPGTATVNLMQLLIFRGSPILPAELPVIEVPRPCYLADLQSVSIPASNRGNLTFHHVFAPHEELSVQFNGRGESMTYANLLVNSMSHWPPLANYAVGSIYEMSVEGAGHHPLHMHVNPYQITAMPLNSYNDGYFQVGDWHDTLMIGGLNASLITVRLQTDKFTGKMVIHCHLLSHEDQGMMAFINITGKEGSTYAVDKTCYDTAWDSTHGTWAPAPTSESFLSPNRGLMATEVSVPVAQEATGAVRHSIILVLIVASFVMLGAFGWFWAHSAGAGSKVVGSDSFFASCA